MLYHFLPSVCLLFDVHFNDEIYCSTTINGFSQNSSALPFPFRPAVLFSNFSFESVVMVQLWFVSKFFIYHYFKIQFEFNFWRLASLAKPLIIISKGRLSYNILSLQKPWSSILFDNNSKDLGNDTISYKKEHSCLIFRLPLMRHYILVSYYFHCFLLLDTVFFQSNYRKFSLHLLEDSLFLFYLPNY